ncbi:MAG: hypothetical protein NC452_03925 [Eubacterium sp.]|nr:hypothetical protein [Eubacterium sp.]
MSNKWFYCFNADDGNDFSEIEMKISENPDHEELDSVAQALLFYYGYTSEDDYVAIGKGELVTIESIGDCLGDEIIERLEDIAADRYGNEDYLFSSAKKEDIADLDRRIEQTLKKWEEERNVMNNYYTIPDLKRYYYHGDKVNKEEQK